MVLVPTGSLEQHGPHLPLDVDTRVATAVAHAVAECLDGPALVAPAVNYGASGEHEAFAGTVSIGSQGLRLLLVELGRSACRWAGAVVFVNGHGGNAAALVSAVTLLRAEGRRVAWAACATGGDAHAGFTETSLMLALDPALVRTEAARPGNTTPIRELMPALREGGVAGVSPNGVLGDPGGASADHGRVLLDQLVADITRQVEVFDVGADGRLRAGNSSPTSPADAA